MWADAELFTAALLNVNAYENLSSINAGVEFGIFGPPYSLIDNKDDGIP